jgi:hypothetical protein
MWTLAAVASFVLWLILGLVVLPALDGSPPFQQLFAAAFAVFFLWAVGALAYDARLRR